MDTVNAVMTEAPVVTNRCKIEEVLAGPFIELIVLAPMNPVVRGLILAQTGKMPEPERQTFEQIKEWVETTCDKKVRPSNNRRSPSRDGIVITVDFSETEYGRSDYSVSRSGTGDFALDEETLIGYVQEAIDDCDGIDNVIEQIAAEIEDDAWNRCEPDMDTYGDYEYNDHDADDTSNSEIEFSRTQIRERLLEFLQTHHPQLFEELL